MFWATEEESTRENSITTLLEAGNVTLLSVLDDPYVLQEVRNNNPKLVEFLTREEIVLEMIETALRPHVDETLPIKSQYRSSHMCTEILTVPCSDLSNALLAHEKAIRVLTEVLQTSLNPIVASFYMKMVSHLFSRNTAQMLDVLSGAEFIKRCLEQMNLSAMADMLLRILSIPHDNEMIARSHQWYVNAGFVAHLLSLFTEKNDTLVHQNACYLWSELVRSIRDLMYSNEDKENVLLVQLQSEESVNRLLDAIFKRDPSTSELNESVVMNGCSILVTLLETNFIPNRPSHHIDEQRVETWQGGVPDAPSAAHSDTSNVWQPDAARVVETAVVARAPELIAAVVSELKREERQRGDSWHALLELLIELVDTNSHTTHLSLHLAFKNNNLKQLFSLGAANPSLALLHRLLLKLVQFVLHSSTAPETPLLVYLFNDVDMPAVVAKGSRPECVRAPLALSALRAFFMHVGEALEKARSTGPNRQRIDGILKACAKWNDLHPILSAYIEANKPAVVDGPLPSTNSSRAAIDDIEMGNCEPSHLAHAVLHEFDKQTACQSLPSPFDAPLTSLSGPLDSKHYTPTIRMEVDIESPLQSTGISESTIDQLCSLRSHSIFSGEDSWPHPSGLQWNHSGTGERAKEKDSSRNCAVTEWTTSSSSTAFSSSNTDAFAFDVEWETKNIKAADLGDDWPTSPSAAAPLQSAGNNANSSWADFSTLEKAADGSGGTAGDWATASASAVEVEPVMAGLASGLISASIERSSASTTDS